jgi:hypothetical protein
VMKESIIPKQWAAVFGKDDAQTRSIIPKSVQRFSEKDDAQTRS